MSGDEYNAMKYILDNNRDRSFYEEVYKYRNYSDYLIKDYLTENWVSVNLTREGIQMLNVENFIDEMIRLFYLSV